MSERIVVGYWDCKYCDTKSISGLEKRCPNCGNPQAKGTKFYMNPKKVEYVESKKAAEYGKGADWICAYCNSYNRYYATSCSNCGSEKKEAQSDYFGNKVETPDNHYDNNTYYDTPYTQTDDSKKESEDQQSTYDEDIFSSYRSNSSKRYYSEYDEDYSFLHSLRHKIDFSKLATFGTITTIALLVIFLIVQLFTPRYYDATVNNKTWERNIYIEELRTFNESDWSIPTGGRVYDQREEIYSYDQVFDHYEKESYQVPYEVFDHTEYSYSDNGDGTFTEHSHSVYRTEYRTEYRDKPVYRSVPVYKTKYYYYIDRWTHSRTITSTGKTNTPYWNEDFVLGEKERESNRTETYTLYFSTEKKQYSMNVPYNEWKSISISTKVKIKVVAGFVTEYSKNGFSSKDM